MANGTQMVFDELRYLGSLGISGVFAPIPGINSGQIPFLHQMRIITVTNLTNETIYISTDGITPMEVVPALSGKVLDICAARTGGDLNGAYIAQNVTIYALSATGAATGDGVYVTCLYVFGD